MRSKCFEHYRSHYVDGYKFHHREQFTFALISDSDSAFHKNLIEMAEWPNRDRLLVNRVVDV